MLDIQLLINSEEVDLLTSSTIIASDSDFIQFRVKNLVDSEVEIFVEDYLLPLKSFDNSDYLFSINDKIFRESFGYCNVRFFINNELVSEIVFNILTQGEKFEQIKSMVSYLLNNNERILDICFSRTKFKISSSGPSNATFETILLSAEKIIEYFLNKKNLLSSTLRSHLLPIKEEINEFNLNNINPFEIIENIADLIPSNELDAIQLNNKTYSLSNIKRENFINSYNLIENQILIGGLFSIKSVLNEILFSIKNNQNLTYDKEYKNLKGFQNNFSIDDLYLQLTTSGMELRIETLLNSISIILFEMQKILKINFNGYILPRITPSVRHSSFYLSIFKELNNWYELGSPNIGIDQTLTKIRSTSKIYEIFCLYKIIENFINTGWEVIRSTEHNFFKNFIPSHIEFKKHNTIVNIYYEKVISPLDIKTLNNDLVYLKHDKKSLYNFYTPDFIIKKEDEFKNIGYYILDSKYSSTSTLSKFDVLNELFRKYHSNIGVYNSNNKTLSSDKILSVNALHPFGDKKLSKWHKSEYARIIPDVSSIKISSTIDELSKIMALIEI